VNHLFADDTLRPSRPGYSITSSAGSSIVDGIVRPAEHLRRVHIDDQLELGGPLDRAPEIPR